MTVDSATFRSVLAQWPSGVSVVTTLATDPTHGTRPHGMTASSLTSVSLDPPLVSVCIANHLPTRELIGRSGIFAVSILGKDQSEIGKRFAGAHAAPERFNGGSWQVAATGCPVLSDATGWIDCRLEHVYPGGDHTIFVGHVVAADTPRLGAPLLFHSRAWGQLADPLPDGIAIRAPSGGYVIADAFAADREQQVLADIARARDGLADIARARDGLADIARARDGLADIARAHDGLTDIASDGHNEICLVEAGNASPVQVRRVLQEAVVIAQGRQLRVRLRAHHGLGLVNALVAMKSGVRLFDATSDGADGSLRASDLAYLAAQLGIACTSPFVRTAP